MPATKSHLLCLLCQLLIRLYYKAVSDFATPKLCEIPGIKKEICILKRQSRLQQTTKLVTISDKNKVYYMRIVMKYHALFVIFEKASKFLIVVCCKL